MIRVWYHRDSDGFASAYAAWRKFGDDVLYKGVQYEENIPEVRSDDEVYILDFSYPRDDLMRMVLDGVKLQVFDHHVTAEANLKGLDFAHFDKDKSGCRLSWEFFHPDLALPRILAYIEDRDLWRFQLPDSEAINTAFCCYKWDFKIWDGIIRKDSVNRLKVAGKHMLQFQQTLVRMAMSKMHKVKLAGHEVPIVNSSVMPSEIGHAMLDKFPDAPFVAIWHRNRTKLIVNLRSKGEFDVSAIAKQFGGGGHKNAAGFIANATMLPFEGFR